MSNVALSSSYIYGDNVYNRGKVGRVNYENLNFCVNYSFKWQTEQERSLSSVYVQLCPLLFRRGFMVMMDPVSPSHGLEMELGLVILA